VEVVVPSDRMGEVMSDLQNRRAIIQSMESENGFEHLRARVPLVEMLRYSTALSSLTSGRATFSIRPGGDEQGPLEIQKKRRKATKEYTI